MRQRKHIKNGTTTAKKINDKIIGVAQRERTKESRQED